MLQLVLLYIHYFISKPFDTNVQNLLYGVFVVPIFLSVAFGSKTISVSLYKHTVFGKGYTQMLVKVFL